MILHSKTTANMKRFCATNLHVPKYKIVITKIPNLDALLNSEDTNESIIELDNFIGEPCDYGDDFSKLTDHQKFQSQRGFHTIPLTS